MSPATASNTRLPVLPAVGTDQAGAASFIGAWNSVPCDVHRKTCGSILTSLTAEHLKIKVY